MKKKYTKDYRPDSVGLITDIAYVIALAESKANADLERSLDGWRESCGDIRAGWRKLIRTDIEKIRRVDAVEDAYRECGRIVIK